MKLIPFLSKSSETTWPWQCGVSSPRTLSFRADDATVFGASQPYHHPNFAADQYSSPDDDSVEKVIKGLRSERLFFEPGQTSSKLEEEAAATVEEESPFKESVAMSVESTDPFLDFRRSMEEMVTAHHHHGHEDEEESGLKVLDWEFLEELLTCYLKINGKSNHGYIVGAFVDLLVSLSAHSSSSHPSNHEKSPAAAAATAAIILPPSSSPSSSSSSSNENCLLSCTNSHSFTSPLSFCSSTCSTSPCLSFPQDRD
ncbi:PREDICTED: transcription repressor OFP15-like [Ipomoea nil]|uniref:transcription repressor OFP15-like n=1 Tax=Ipomoea nil TaxID=35883 RepID=UPI000901B617|nr:PREDICTED: transcription repressor OFP15-like [Ipomoea nil]